MSGQMLGERYDLRALTDADAAGSSGVPHDEGVGPDCPDRGVAGSADLGCVAAHHCRGEREQLPLEASAVAGNFERMVRIADGTGIALDGAFDTLTASYRSELGLDRYGSAASTPPTPWLQSLIGRLVAPLAPYAMRWMARRQRRAAA